MCFWMWSWNNWTGNSPWHRVFGSYLKRLVVPFYQATPRCISYSAVWCGNHLWPPTCPGFFFWRQLLRQLLFELGSGADFVRCFRVVSCLISDLLRESESRNDLSNGGEFKNVSRPALRKVSTYSFLAWYRKGTKKKNN